MLLRMWRTETDVPTIDGFVSVTIRLTIRVYVAGMTLLCMCVRVGDDIMYVCTSTRAHKNVTNFNVLLSFEFDTQISHEQTTRFQKYCAKEQIGERLLD